MTDQFLVNELARRHFWVKKVYENTSGYVHLSEKHIFNAMQASEEEYALTLKITDKDASITDAFYIEAIEAFRATTDVLFEYVHGWAYTKNNPEEAARELGKQLKANNKCKAR